MPNKTITGFLRKGKIIGENETLNDMVLRVFNEISVIEGRYNTPPEELRERLASLFYEDYIVPSTPILTNAGRHSNKPLAACSVPHLRKGITRAELENMINDYHQKGMGTGFNLDDSDDPVNELLYLNEIAVREIERNLIERPVGNLALVSIDHPKIFDFVSIKSGMLKTIDWKFNIAVNLKRDFMDALAKNENYRLKDGTTIDTNVLFDFIVEQAYSCGEPGLAFLDRFEEQNITPHLGKYLSLAPCGEISMASGEVCQFSYINIGRLFRDNSIDYDLLQEIVKSTVHMLDNILDISIDNLEDPKSKRMVEQKRKIGIGICGFSDMLFELGVPYQSKEAQLIAEDLLSFINYESKKESVELAKARGAFPAFYDPETRTGLIMGKYIPYETRTVSSGQWEELEHEMMQHGIRNVSTVTLPPTGRSSIIINASASIEPSFRLTVDDKLKRSLKRNCLRFGYEKDLEPVYQIIGETGSVQETDLPEAIKDIYRTCLELTYDAHLDILSHFQRFTDDSISKTINMPNDCSRGQVRDACLKADRLELKGITVYRNGTRDQPLELAKEK